MFGETKFDSFCWNGLAKNSYLAMLLEEELAFTNCSSVVIFKLLKHVEHVRESFIFEESSINWDCKCIVNTI
jgi:hypothetical protein